MQRRVTDCNNGKQFQEGFFLLLWPPNPLKEDFLRVGIAWSAQGRPAQAACQPQARWGRGHTRAGPERVAQWRSWVAQLPTNSLCRAAVIQRSFLGYPSYASGHFGPQPAQNQKRAKVTLKPSLSPIPLGCG